ncbi:hypothetical protein [Stagnihabitans tardus]|uniref:Uncharacterized protein n=1 Tax=Stagnihabitans tardus TaxID=2699202 RepID=A0AAE4Y9Z7_9RHOB|nr:hypothetical protein [Stagnihabitans tardus]NBZ87596.1 hypothetical protein [Stagnihabitans tardus]
MSLGLVGGALLGLSAGAAGAEILECRLRRGQGLEGLIEPQYLFDHTPGAVTGQVYDGLIDRVKGRPLVAQVRDEATRVVYSWELDVKDRWGNPQRVGFQAELMRADGKVEIKALMLGDAVAEGFGLCRLP